jgi:hypothetical protein
METGAVPVEVVEEGVSVARPVRPRWGRLRVGCAGLVLFVCGGTGVLTAALRAGPVAMQMPGGTELRMGSQEPVLSNFTFQDGTSYYLDLVGNGVRNIVEVNYLEDSRSVEIVLHHSTKEEQVEKQLVKMKLP